MRHLEFFRLILTNQDERRPINVVQPSEDRHKSHPVRVAAASYRPYDLVDFTM